MEKYLAAQIAKGTLKYSEVIEKYSQFKDGIDRELKERWGKNL